MSELSIFEELLEEKEEPQHYIPKDATQQVSPQVID